MGDRHRAAGFELHATRGRQGPDHHVDSYAVFHRETGWLAEQAATGCKEGHGHSLVRLHAKHEGPRVHQGVQVGVDELAVREGHQVNQQ